MQANAALEHRLERLEKDNRRWRRLCLAAVLLLGFAMLSGLTPSDRVIDAEAFTLLGADGKPRAVLALIDTEPTLALFDDAGRVRAGLSVVQNTPRLILYGEDGIPMWQAP